MPASAIPLNKIFTLFIFSLLVHASAEANPPCCTICKCKIAGSGHVACACAATCTCGPIRRLDGSIIDHEEFRAMDAMMREMEKTPWTGPPARHFLAQMIAHHRGAVTMANAHLAKGRNAPLLQLSKAIIAGQKYEIQLMENLLKSLSNKASPLAPEYQKAMKASMVRMMVTLPVDERLLKDPDRSYAAVMQPHHQAAIDMAVVILQFDPDLPTRRFAEKIIVDQEAEIRQLREFLNP